ncbi:MAG: PrpF domain-containing protein [Pseudomonadota bacterium]
MLLRAIRCVFMRGGTSKALMFHIEDLPEDRKDWADIFLSAMGSPDEYGRQLDGMGGGISSLSKVCIVGPPSRPDADVDFTFCQVSPREAKVDYAGNCGNMSSAIGPFAVDEGLVPQLHDGQAMVRIHNTNTNKIIQAHFEVRDGLAVVDGDLRIDGVSGTGAAIRLDFLDPGGARTSGLLPTGQVIDMIDIGDTQPIQASLVDAANPSVFVRAADVGLSGTELPEEIEHDSALLVRLEKIRQAGSVKMGMCRDLAEAARQPSQPKIAMLAAPAPAPLLSGSVLPAADHDISCRMISMDRPHRAIPITGALCLAAAVKIPGTIAAEAAAKIRNGDIRIGHPSGVTLVDAEIRQGSDGVLVERATVYRTARRLFQGDVLYRVK